MSRICELTGKRPRTGNLVSHANNKSKRLFSPNLKYRKVVIPELGVVLRLRLSTRAMRTIDKHGSFAKALRAAKPADLSPRLRTLRDRLARGGTKAQSGT